MLEDIGGGCGGQDKQGEESCVCEGTVDTDVSCGEKEERFMKGEN